ncbi:hypothetical protein N431DRAFT_501388 [Stipitochalara longipes BDJ]|nr:hypothetical protein N431DRAFT_501388 [Stipitochalara longipes BDJ]
MDAAEGWNFDDYPLFFADESSNLFGEYDLTFDINNFLIPEVDQTSNSFHLGEWDGPAEAVNSAHPELNFQLPPSEEREGLNPILPAELYERSHDFDPSPNSARSPDSEEQDSADGSAVSIPGCEPQLKTSAAKRKYLRAFSAKSGQDVGLHTRKQFSEEQKKVVALNRTIGVCLHCRLRKVACDNGIPCNRCIKRAGSISSGQGICMRRGLVATRFDHIDLFRIANIESGVKGISLTPERQIIGWGFMWFPSNDDTYSSEAYIKVPLMHFEPFGFRQTRELISVNYYHKSYVYVHDTSQAIFPGRVPTVERLLQAYLTSRRDCTPETSPFSRLSKAFRDFAKKYCDKPDELPLKGLLLESLKLQHLLHIYRVLPSIKSSPSCKDSELVSNFIWLQIRLPICMAIRATETYVLAETDKLVEKKIGIGRENPLAAWAILWILILAYKELMIFRKGCCRDDDTGSERIYLLSQHLYNMLTSMYAALYKTTSPLTLDWRSKDIAAMLGNDASLITLFCNIKTEMFWFQAHTHELFPEDSLFKTLVVENENKLIAAHIKAAKRQGII